MILLIDNTNENKLNIQFNGVNLDVLKFVDHIVWTRDSPSIELSTEYVFLNECNNNTADVDIFSNVDWSLN
jgi:hypothetical protein